MHQFRIEPLGSGHDLQAFDCGVEPLNTYLRRQAGQDVRRNVTTCFLIIEAATGVIAGFYTMAATSIGLVDLPDKLTKKLPKYPVVPAALIGRLAIHVRFQGQGLGGEILVDAIDRVANASIGIYALVVDAKSDAAIRFYQHYGFQSLIGQPDRLFLPLQKMKGLRH